jgi:hypothetical protein
MRRVRFLLLATLLALFVGAASSASALSFTLSPDPISFTVGSASGSIALVGGSQGQGLPSGAIQLSGTTGASDDVLIFAVTVTAGTLDEVGVGVFPPATLSSGSGWIAGSGVDVLIGPTNTSATRSFNFAGGGLSVGQTSDAFFVSYASLGSGSSVNFSVKSGASALTVSATSGLASVPEPGLAALLLGGLAVLAGGARRLRS